MVYLLKIILCSIFAISYTFLSLGQEVVASDGGFFENAQGSFAYTIGETVTETVQNSNGIFTQGFQQNFEDILGVSALLQESNILLFPNPIHDQVTIQWSDLWLDLVSLQINDAFGKTVRSNQFANSQTSPLIINDLSGLVPGIYYLTLFVGKSSEPLLFKVIKK